MRFNKVHKNTTISNSFNSITDQEESQNRELTVLEYSPSQDAFNVTTFEKMISNNLKSIFRNHCPDYIPIVSSFEPEVIYGISRSLRQMIDRRKEKDENRPKKDYRTQEPDLTERYNSKGPEEKYAE